MRPIALGIAAALAGTCCAAPGSATSRNGAAPRRIDVTAVPVALDPSDPKTTSLGDFTYAGGLALTSTQTRWLHELSDLNVTGPDRFAAVGDQGVLVEARFVLDRSGRLAGVADATIAWLVGENGEPFDRASGDAEGLALLPTGDRLVSFERRARILLYPGGGGRPRRVPAPAVSFDANLGMEALTADPDAGADAYIVGAEDSGETWRCRLTAQCVKGTTIEKPVDFGLVALDRLPGGLTACLLRAYEPIPGARVTLKILRERTVVARMDLAPPLTVDNFEGLASVGLPGGQRRFYIISDDNNNPGQRTLLLAFDWSPH